MICAVVEHVLSIMTTIYYVHVCKQNEDQITIFFKAQMFEMFELTSYALWKAIIGKFVNIVATVIWNYLNLFIVIVSFGITSRFKQLNRELNRIKGEVILLTNIDQMRKILKLRFISLAYFGKILGNSKITISSSSHSLPSTRWINQSNYNHIAGK